MTAERIDGKAVAARIKDELKVRVDALRAKGVVPGLGTVLVGADPGSQIYVGGKHKDCAQVGIESIRVDLPEETTQAQLDEAIQALNENPACTGYIVQLPLPKHLDEHRALSLIDPDKDADGLAPASLGKLVLTEPGPLPCTPRGIVELLTRNGVDLHGKDVVVLGRGVTVGRSIGLLMGRRDVNATVTTLHTGTVDVPEKCRRADVIIAASGVKHMVTPDMVKEGAVVVDVGVTREPNPDKPGKFRTLGDVHPDVAEVAGWISPNPGGVGPMTRAMLLANVVDACEQRQA